MDKILISNSFKNLLQSLGAKDASNLSNISSKAVPVVDTASSSAGTLLGYSTMSTLASVLGVPTIAGTIKTYVESNEDLNNLTVYPCYSCKLASIASTVINMPSNASKSVGFIVLNFQPYSNANYETQFFVQAGAIWSRVKSSPSTWETWRQLAFVQ